MPTYKAQTDYDVLYNATCLEAQNWSPVRLTITLSLILAKRPADEAHWGVINAITDLLGQIKPPVWRQRMS